MKKNGGKKSRGTIPLNTTIRIWLGKVLSNRLLLTQPDSGHFIIKLLPRGLQHHSVQIFIERTPVFTFPPSAILFDIYTRAD